MSITFYTTIFQTKLGWTYEYADEDTQRYKEGKFILERALIVEFDQVFGYDAYQGPN